MNSKVNRKDAQLCSSTRGDCLPGGWEVKKLIDACYIKPPKSEARSKLGPKDMVSFVPMENLGIDQKFFLPKQERPLAEVEGSYTYFAEGDVLLAKITPCFENGKLGIANNLINGIGFGSSEYIVFRPHDILFNEFLYYYLSQESFRIEGAERMAGAVGHKRVAKDFIEETLIPLPPLPEQKRIVAILDEVFSALARAKENAQKNLANARELYESYLQGVFANPGDDWEEKTLGEVAEVVGGFSFKSHEFIKAGKYQVIRMGNVRPGIIRNDEKSLSRSLLKKNDIIITQTGTRKKRDYGYTVAIDKDNYLLNQRLAAIRFPKNYNYNFFLYFSWTEKFRDQFFANETGMVGQGNVGIGAITGALIPVPRIEEQLSIVKKIDVLSTETKKLESIYRKKIANLDELKKSILEKAFKGAL